MNDREFHIGSEEEFHNSYDPWKAYEEAKKDFPELFLNASNAQIRCLLISEVATAVDRSPTTVKKLAVDNELGYMPKGGRARRLSIHEGIGIYELQENDKWNSARRPAIEVVRDLCEMLEKFLISP